MKAALLSSSHLLPPGTPPSQVERDPKHVIRNLAAERAVIDKVAVLMDVDFAVAERAFLTIVHEAYR